MKMLDYVYAATMDFMEGMPKSKRKGYGQFFTSKETARFMAEMLTVPQGQTSLRILDPGAGSGILSAALLERLDAEAGIHSIELVCYENDPNITELLLSNLSWAARQAAKEISCRVVTENYILSQKDAYNSLPGANPDAGKYDMVIGNPPYKKIAKDAPEAAAMPDVCYGAPNLYFLFAAMSLFNLKVDGEMVYIIPRSWTSGAYFQQFRRRFFEDGVLEHMHLFASRDKVFEKESVLQETLIIKAKKGTKKPKEITITTTQNNADFYNKTLFKVPYSTVVDRKKNYVYLVTNAEEMHALTQLNGLTKTLPDIGLRMKTGLTVDFRNSDALRDYAENDAVPLFFAQHIQNGKAVFPIGKKHEYLVADKNSLLQKNTNYLFVKRFTAKEERRRLQCGVYLAGDHPEYTKISTQNKINFISGQDGLSECAVYGLYVLFNSKLYDRYYRTLNGSTQVNSSEINSMPVPALDAIEAMGEELLHAQDMSEAACEGILQSYLNKAV